QLYGFFYQRPLQLCFWSQCTHLFGSRKASRVNPRSDCDYNTDTNHTNLYALRCTTASWFREHCSDYITRNGTQEKRFKGNRQTEPSKQSSGDGDDPNLGISCASLG